MGPLVNSHSLALPTGGIEHELGAAIPVAESMAGGGIRIRRHAEAEAKATVKAVVTGSARNIRDAAQCDTGQQSDHQPPRG